MYGLLLMGLLFCVIHDVPPYGIWATLRHLKLHPGIVIGRRDA